MARRGELEEREAAEGKELFLLVERGQRQGLGGRFQEKHPSPPKSAGEKVENWKQPQGLN